MAYDPHCEDLARLFLAENPDLEALAPVLAQEIQDSIDMWLEEMNDDEDD